MRGKAKMRFGRKLFQRITPAYAGKRLCKVYPWKVWWDHPRLCGEKCEIYTVLDFGNEITPAYAGKSDTLFRALLHFRDHPRLCGEKNIPRSV